MSPFQISKAVWDMLWAVVLGWRNNPRFALWHYCQIDWHVFVSMKGCPTINLRIITLLHQFFTTLPSRERSRETSCIKLWGISCLGWSLLFKLSVDLEWQQNLLTIPLLFISLSEVLGYRFCCFLMPSGCPFSLQSRSFIDPGTVKSIPLWILPPNCVSYLSSSLIQFSRHFLLNCMKIVVNFFDMRHKLEWSDIDKSK